MAQVPPVAQVENKLRSSAAEEDASFGAGAEWP